MHFTFHQLNVFLKVSECQSITKAAEELHLTQPAVSLQLKKLQDQFDLPLTEVIGRQLFITDFGKQIALRCEKILNETEGIKFTVDQYKGLLSGHIKISVVSTGKYVIPYFLKSFMDQYPGVDISIDVSNKGRVIEGLSNNKSDFSLVSVVPDNIEVHSLELMENRLYLIGSKSLQQQIKSPKDLEKVTLVFREEGSATRMAMEEYLDKHKIKLKKSLTLVSNEAVKQAVNAGLGFSIMPLIGLKLYLDYEQLEIFPLSDLPIVTRWNLIYNKGKKLTPAQKTLLDFIQQNKQVIMKDNFNWALSH